MELVEPVQMNITKVIPIEKYLSWLHFGNEQRVQESQQGKDQQSCISVFVAHLTIPSCNYEHQPIHDSRIACIVYGRYIDIQSNIRRKELPRTNQGSNLLEGSFSNRDNVKAPIQFRRES